VWAILLGAVSAVVALLIYRDRSDARLAEIEKSLERSERKRLNLRKKLSTARRPRRRRLYRDWF
jgi:hypothetical protein